MATVVSRVTGGAVVVVTVCGLLIGVSAPAGADTTGWKTGYTISYPGLTFRLGGVACLPTGTCTAVGSAAESGAPDASLVVTGSGHAWSTQASPKAFTNEDLAAVSCPASGACTAVGQSIGLKHIVVDPVAATQDGGTWQVSTLPLPANEISLGNQFGASGVSCPTTTMCLAVGSYYDSIQHQIAFLDVQGPSGWALAGSGTSTPEANSWSGLNGSSCWSSTGCVAVGWSTSEGQPSVPLVGTWDGATWQASTPLTDLPGMSVESLSSVSCWAAGECVAVGEARQYTLSTSAVPVVAVLHAGTWTTSVPATAGTDTSASLNSVSCVDGSHCMAVGVAATPGAVVGTAFADSFDGSTWRPVTGIEPSGSSNSQLDGVSCTYSSCTAVGTPNVVSLGSEAFITTTTAQWPTWGYWQVGSDGSVYASGTAPYLGSAARYDPVAPTVGMAATHDRQGYWLTGSDGGVFSFGDAAFHGSTGAMRLNQPIVGMAATPDGGGYWLVASDGGVFAFGDAGFYGSTGNIRLNQPVVGMAATPDGKGYWLVASDGGVFAFGDAGFYGSTGNIHLNQPVVAMAAAPDGRGYWMLAADGGVFAYGDAPFAGSLASWGPFGETGILAAPDGKGYLISLDDGSVVPFGSAVSVGDATQLPLGGRIVGIAS